MFLQGRQTRNNVSAFITTYRCVDCDENRVENETNRCSVCGSTLELIRTETQRIHERDSSSILDVFDGELRAIMEELLFDSQTTRQISQKYLKSIGRINVDERKTVLSDITLDIETLKIMAIPASFGPLLSTGSTSGLRIVLANPRFGEFPLTNSNEVKGSVVLLQRGVVSFAKKAMYAIEAGAALVVIAQTSDMWPFMMTDNANEFHVPDAYLIDTATDTTTAMPPIVMISKRDATLLELYINQSQSLSSSSSSAARTTSTGSSSSTNTGTSHGIVTPAGTATVVFTVHEACQTECCICQEDMAVGNEVLKLHCRHVYHSQCVESWLEKHNTCPMCRSEMPLQENTPEQRRTEIAADPHRMPYFR
eukprot:gene2926-5742_t